MIASKTAPLVMIIVLILINLFIIWKVSFTCYSQKNLEFFNEQSTANRVEEVALLSKLLATDKDIEVDNKMNFRKGAGIYSPSGLGFIPEGQTEPTGTIQMVDNVMSIKGNPNTRVEGSLNVSGNYFGLGWKNALQRSGNTLNVGSGYNDVSITKNMKVGGDIVGRKLCIGSNKCIDDGMFTKLEQLPNKDEINATMNESKDKLEKSLGGKLNTMNKMIQDDGTLNVSGNANFKGGSSSHNPHRWGTHFPWRGDNKNYIRGDTEIRGNTNHIGRFSVNTSTTDFKGGVSIHNPNNAATHFPWAGDNRNYIRGDTEIRGNTTHVGDFNIKQGVGRAPQLCIGNTCINEEQLKKVVFHGDKITIRGAGNSSGTAFNNRLQGANWSIGNASFANKNRGGWEQMFIEKCSHPGVGDNQRCWR
jgi:hypothetical protein